MTCPWNFCRIQVWPKQDCGKAQICLFWTFVPLSFPLCLFSFSFLFLSFIAFFGLAEHTSHLSHGDRSGKEQELCKPAVYRAFHPAVSAVQAPRLTLKHNDQRPSTAKRNKELLFIWKKVVEISCKSLTSLSRQLFENWRLYRTDSIVGSLWTFLTWLPGWPHIYHYLIIGYWWCL